MYEERPVYTLPLRVKVVAEVTGRPAPAPTRFWDLDANGLAETVARRSPIEAILMFWAHGSEIWASLRVQGRTWQVPDHLDGVNLGVLDNLLQTLKEQIQPVAEHLTWTKVLAFAGSPQRQNLLLFVVAQDVAHDGVGTSVPRRRQRLGCYAWWPVFRSISGRFWVSTEAIGVE